MPLLLLVRHAVTPDTGSVLYGRAEGVSLSEEGRRQAERLAERLAPLPIAAVYSSPLQRCVETARPIAAAKGLEVRTAPGLLEGEIGEWTGRRLSELRRTKPWKAMMRAPASFRYPGGESFVEYQGRAVAEAARIAGNHPEAAVTIVTHGDTIGLLLSHIAGAHLDHFPRIVVSPASVSAVWIPPEGGPPSVLRVNDTGTLEDLVPRWKGRRRNLRR